MKQRPAPLSILVLLASALNGCTDEPTGITEAAEQDLEGFSHPVLGVSLQHPANWTAVQDEYLFKTFGVTFINPTGGESQAPGTAGEEGDEWALRVSLVPGASPAQLEALVQETIDAFPDELIRRFEVRVGGVPGVAISPVPGREASTQVFVAANGHVYNFAYSAEETSPPALLAGVRFRRPTEAVGSLKLRDVNSEEVQYGGRRPTELIVNPSRDPGPVFVEPAPLSPTLSLSTSSTGYCGSYQPSDMWIGIQWGKYANKDADDVGADMPTGWSKAGPSFWNEGAHQRCTYTNMNNDYYAVDHVLNVEDAIYAPAWGTVTYAGWDDNPTGWGSYGRMVVIDLDYGGSVVYTNLNAHLSKITVKRGDRVNNATVIGYAGGSSGTSNTRYHVHLHTAFYKSNRWTWNGSTREGSGGYLPYGGSAMRWTKVYSTSAGSYTNWSFSSRGRWMQY